MNDQEKDFFADTSPSTGKNKKNFFDFEDDENEEIFVSLSNSATAKQPQQQLSNATTGKRSFSLSGDADVGVNSTSIKLTTPSFDYKCDDADRKVADLISSLNATSINNGLSDDTSSTATNNNASTNSNTTASPRIAIERILAGDVNVNLSVFRGKEQKVELLDYALLTGDSYVISKCVMFLRETLKLSIFHYEISRRPLACEQYLQYLRNTEQTDTLVDTLVMLGRHEEAAFASYARVISSSQSNENKIKQLYKSLAHFTSGGVEVTQWQCYIQEHILLLEHQLPIESDDARREAQQIDRLQSGDTGSTLNTFTIASSAQPFAPSVPQAHSSSNLFVIFPRPKLLGLPVLPTLHYCCLYHFDLPENNFASPFNVRKQFSLTEKQFLWTSLQALSKCGAWPDIDNLFEYKSWLGSRKVKNSIAIADVVRVLYQHSAPIDMLEKYLELVDDVERRFQLAKEVRRTKFAADILIKLKDRKRLAELRASMQMTATKDATDSSTLKYIDNVLRTSTIKWKN